MPIRLFQGHQPKLGQRVYVDPAAAVIGRVDIGDDSSLWPMVSIRGDVHEIRIGQRSNIQDGTIIHVTAAGGPLQSPGYPTIIGDDVTIGHQAMIHACVIHDRSLIGMNAIILDGAEIASEVVVAAGSIVPPGKKLDRGYLYMGQPVKPVRALTDRELAHFDYSSEHYVKLKNQYLDQKC